MSLQRRGFPFLALGIAFIAIGIPIRQNVFMFVGIAFLVVGFTLLRRGRR